MEGNEPHMTLGDRWNTVRPGLVGHQLQGTLRQTAFTLSTMQIDRQKHRVIHLSF